MPRRRRRVSRLSLFYFVVTLGILVGGSVWLDRRGEVTTGPGALGEGHILGERLASRHTVGKAGLTCRPRSSSRWR